MAKHRANLVKGRKPRRAPNRRRDRVGAPGGARTPDLRLRRPTLYPTELRAQDFHHSTRPPPALHGSLFRPPRSRPKHWLISVFREQPAGKDLSPGYVACENSRVAPSPFSDDGPLTRHVASTEVSLPEVHGSVAVPTGAGFWRKLFAFAGPGYLVAVGYMDPGNWATDIAGGARYGYALLSVVFASNLIAILLQSLAARLGIASGRDLAQACRDRFSRRTTLLLWGLAEIAIAATDLAEVIGSAIALNLLFGLPMVVGVCLTSPAVLIVLYLQHHKFRYVEGLVVLLIAGIGAAFAA